MKKTSLDKNTMFCGQKAYAILKKGGLMGSDRGDGRLILSNIVEILESPRKKH